MEEMPLAFLIGKLSNRIRRRIIELAADFPYTGAQGKILYFLLTHKEAVYQKDIEQEFSLRPSSATELLKKMEEAGLLYRACEERDARLKRIVLTEKALSYDAEIQKGLHLLEMTMREGIKEKDEETFRKICMRMLENIDG